MAVGLNRRAGDTAAQRAAQQLADEARTLPPGARLGTKSELRQRCGVSVGTFNEAVRLAQAQGVVAMRPGPGGGLFAAQQPPMVLLGNAMLALNAGSASVADAVRIRDALDPLLIIDALDHSSPAHIGGYREQLRAMRDAMRQRDARAYMRANLQLHRRIAAVSPSAMLRSIYLGLLDIIEGHTRDILPAGSISAGEEMSRRYRVHAHLTDAIARQDAADTHRLIAEHSLIMAADGRRPPAPTPRPETGGAPRDRAPR